MDHCAQTLAMGGVLTNQQSMSIEEQHRLEQGRKTLAERVRSYLSNEKFYRSSAFSETSTRTNFIDPFLSALGWDVNDTHNKGPFADVLREQSVYGTVAHMEVLLKPDYTLRVGGQAQLCIEAKRPSADLEAPKSIFQVKTYSWNQRLSVCVLTNFRTLRVFSTATSPNLNLPYEGIIPELRLSCQEYTDRFDAIWELLSYDAVKAGRLSKRASELVKARLEERVDRRFLADLLRWRAELAADLAKTTALSGWELTEACQRLLDRLVFIRVCEDRGIEPQPLLLPLLDSPGINERLRDTLRPFEATYNGTLFKPHLVDTIDYSDRALRRVIAALYPPHSIYRFDVINVEILGTIYERFLGSEVTRLNGRIRVQPKPEVRKSGGIYYTPEWVVDEIVHTVVDPVVAGKPPQQLSKVRILDPACGSGSFLLGTFDRLIQEYERYYTAHPSVHPRDHYEGPGGRRLTVWKKARILVDNLFGVDVDPQAVEVTMMSLYLKALEGEDSASLKNQSNEQQQLLKATFLPKLDRNIVAGNTLVGIEAFQQEAFSGLESDSLRRLNPFDWRDPRFAFREVLDGGGFDAVIGNPPYFSVDASYGRHHPMLDYLRQHYSEVWQDKSDILFYFLARAVALSKRYVAFIVSRAFLEAYKAERLRKFLQEQSGCKGIIDFQGFKVFEDAAISTAIVVLDRSLMGRDQPTRIRRLSEWDQPLEVVVSSLRDGGAPFESFELRLPRSGAPWILKSEMEEEFLASIDRGSVLLKQVASIGQGMQTGDNVAFTITPKQIRELEVPAHLVKRRARNSDVLRYRTDLREEYVLYLEDVSRFRDLPAGVQLFLNDLSRKKRLKERAAYIRGNCEWWRYTWPLQRQRYSAPRLLCPYRAGYNRFSIEYDFSVLSLTDTTVVFLDHETQEDPRYWLGLLNSRLLTWRMRKLAKLTGAHMYEYFWNAVEKLPVRRVDFSNGAEEARHNRIVELVDTLVESRATIARTASPMERELQHRRYRGADLELEGIVLDIYEIGDSQLRAEIEEIVVE